ncbi:hypothetical protein [uncultured Paraglaciecola sp.]|jgi:hypothetical protein|nr:hypothetical protein [uncultured Paraglaciecola sp.]
MSKNLCSSMTHSELPKETDPGTDKYQLFSALVETVDAATYVF